MPGAARLAPEPEQPPVVADAVDGRRGHLVVAEDGPPSAGPRVGGCHERLPLAGLRDDPGEQPRAARVERQEAELVDPEQLRPREPVVLAAGRPAAARPPCPPGRESAHAGLPDDADHGAVDPRVGPDGPIREARALAQLGYAQRDLADRGGRPALAAAAAPVALPAQLVGLPARDLVGHRLELAPRHLADACRSVLADRQVSQSLPFPWNIHRWPLPLSRIDHFRKARF